MSTLLYIIIGLVTQQTLNSCDVTIDTWQFWIILACVVSSMLVAHFLM